MFEYYKKILNNEHYLNATEIAEKYNLVTKTGKVATLFVSKYLSNNKNLKILYYYSKNKRVLYKVFPQEEIPMKQLLNIYKVKNSKKDIQLQICINKKNYIAYALYKGENTNDKEKRCTK